MKLSKELSEIQMLKIGLIGAIITVLGGELPIGWYKTPAAENMIMEMIGGYGSVSTLQLALGVFFGGIGIALQAFGYEALSYIVGKNGNNTKTAKTIHIGALACGFLGPIVHILCIALMYVCRNNNYEEFLSFSIYIVAPISIVFMPIYMIMLVSLFIAIIKGRTLFPKPSAFLNPAIIMMLVNTISFFGGNNEFFHSLQMANMGIGSLCTFLGLLLIYKRKKVNSDIP